MYSANTCWMNVLNGLLARKTDNLRSMQCTVYPMALMLIKRGMIWWVLHFSQSTLALEDGSRKDKAGIMSWCKYSGQWWWELGKYLGDKREKIQSLVGCWGMVGIWLTLRFLGWVTEQIMLCLHYIMETEHTRRIPFGSGPGEVKS